ncbi:hypothetical protein B296_00006358, partial [Ensete ventricosum]
GSLDHYRGPDGHGEQRIGGPQKRVVVAGGDGMRRARKWNTLRPWPSHLPMWALRRCRLLLHRPPGQLKPFLVAFIYFPSSLLVRYNLFVSDHLVDCLNPYYSTEAVKTEPF